ncbi:MAG: hypothetical protein ACYCW6_27225 [Candidatus Xenobia bacterium]
MKMKQALQRMAALHEALTAEPEQTVLDVSEGAERPAPRRSLELWRRGRIAAEVFAGSLQRIADNARDSAARLDAMPAPRDAQGLMARIMTTSREAMADVTEAATRLCEAGLAGRWEDAESALAELEDAQLFLSRIGCMGAHV